MKFLKVQFAITLIIFLVNDFSIGQTNTFPPTGNVGIGTMNPQDKLQVHGNTSLGIGIANSHFPWRGNGWAYVSGKGIIFREDQAGSYLERMRIADNGNVGIGTTNPKSTLDVQGRAQAFKGVYGSGVILKYGPNGKLNAAFAYGTDNANQGGVLVFNENGERVASIGFNEDGLGRVAVTHGQYDLARMDVYKDGNKYKGYIQADVKNFRIPNPKQPNTDIVYACIEGPEAAVYVRGTARLIKGKAVVTLPDHFTSVASSKHMTVQITPLSAESLGLAVIEKRPSGFIIKELQGGTGTYEFDWEVKSIRKGHEKFKVIRSRKKQVRRQYLTK